MRCRAKLNFVRLTLLRLRIVFNLFKCFLLFMRVSILIQIKPSAFFFIIFSKITVTSEKADDKRRKIVLLPVLSWARNKFFFDLFLRFLSALLAQLEKKTSKLSCSCLSVSVVVTSLKPAFSRFDMYSYVFIKPQLIVSLFVSEQVKEAIA